MAKFDVLAKNNELCLNGEWQFRQAGSENWLAAHVPGCNFLDLLNNELISDPFYRAQEAQLQWIETQDWHYRKVFNVTQALLQHTDVELVMAGLDTYCSVYLNDVLVHENSNMFVGQRIACKDALCLGDNELRIEFRSPVNEVMPKFIDNGFTYPAENDKSVERLSVFTRKAPYHYGWDWGPRFVTSGIWRDIKLVGINKARISDVYVQQTICNEDSAQLRFQISLTTYKDFAGQLAIQCENVAGIHQQVAVSRGSDVLEISITVAQPTLWWPNGMGEAFLHHFVLVLSDGEQVLDRQTLDIGIRTIEVINQPDEHGESFFIKVNGYPTFMKGANYIPSDSFLTQVDLQKYEKIFQDACAANMNMLRVWGGGIYENDEFYQLADQYGILIWQDFMFACSLYPGDKDFIENVTQEVEYNVKRLRNHASLALWCGNNETEMGMEFWQWPEKFDYSEQLYQRLQQDYGLLFKSVLPHLVEQLDSQRFYFSSSPIGFWENQADDRKGDNHYWGVWHGEEPFSEFKNRVPRFMSEYGFQSFPLIESVRRYSLAEDWQLNSEVMQTHQKHPRGNALIKQYMSREYREPKDFQSFLYLSQVQQALGMKVAFEAHRGAMPFCMGSLYWQFNDCWPVASWSGIDYYGRWKALHYQAKRSFEQLAVFIDEQADSINVNIVSDALEDNVCQLNECLLTLTGEVLWSNKQNITVAGLSVTRLTADAVAQLLPKIDVSELVYHVELCQQNLLLSEAFHYFVATKALLLTKPTFELASEYQAGELCLSIRSNTLARQVYVSCGDTVDNFSDNFFDLLPDVEKKITVTLGELTNTEVALLLDKITIMSVADSYQEQ